MNTALTTPLRLMILAISTLTMAVLDMDSALAQTRNCDTLSNTLASIERNRDYRNLESAQGDARGAEKDVQRAESAYVRAGCNDAAKRGEQLSRQCKALARRVLATRETLDALKESLQTGTAIAQQREAVLQEMARFNCDSRSSATVNRETRRGNLFDQLFDVFNGVGTRGDDFSGFGDYETIRTVCVRKVDGYYWPISYSTLIEYAPDDLSQCIAQCPGMDVDLYYYDNPGQEPEQMISLSGEPYSSLPAAFAYRTSYDRANSCKTGVTYGSISLAALDTGASRAMINFGDLIFPLPLRDPRRTTEATVVSVQEASYVNVPLPRPRPAAPGETPKPVVVVQAAADPVRIVLFGEKRVRIVGPDTPYAPTVATGT
ncbi:MAG: DUF2865 domain-containing protein [Devosia sp.]